MPGSRGPWGANNGPLDLPPRLASSCSRIPVRAVLAPRPGSCCIHLPLEPEPEPAEAAVGWAGPVGDGGGQSRGRQREMASPFAARICDVAGDSELTWRRAEKRGATRPRSPGAGPRTRGSFPRRLLPLPPGRQPQNWREAGPPLRCPRLFPGVRTPDITMISTK